MFFETKNCGISFGGLKALSGLDLRVPEGEMLGVIGPNGAGKTTFFNLITGVYEPTVGELFLEDQKLNGLKPFEMARRGIARTFQNIRLFSGMSVIGQVLVAFNKDLKANFFTAIAQTKKYCEEEQSNILKAKKLLEIFDLISFQAQPAISLSYGDQRRLEIVRALATQPKLLLLDEPAAGMNAVEKKELVELIKRIHQEFKLTIILIEHDMSVVMNLCPRIIVLDYGVVIAEGTPDEIRNNPCVIEAYLGDAHA
ncbi:MAG: ABC transporter related-protein [uncultured bacterium]|nr:MAG: ABC transporter related-protein [uncultured bacterium]